MKLEEGMICAGNTMHYYDLFIIIFLLFVNFFFNNTGWPNGGQDACQGDSGGPLVANMPGQFQMLRYSDIQRHLPNQMEDEENELTKPSEVLKNIVVIIYLPKYILVLDILFFIRKFLGQTNYGTYFLSK